MKDYYIYILSNHYHGTLYIGVTSNLPKRIYEHKNKCLSGFSEKYNLDKLMHYESFNDIQDAIAREKQLKKWKRDWKINLINEMNSEWADLYDSIL